MNIFELLDIEMDMSYTMDELDLLSRTGYGLMRCASRIALREGFQSPAYLLLKAAEAIVAETIRDNSDGLDLAELGDRLEASRKGFPDRPVPRDGETPDAYDSRVREWIVVWDYDKDADAGEESPEEERDGNGGRVS